MQWSLARRRLHLAKLFRACSIALITGQIKPVQISISQYNQQHTSLLSSATAKVGGNRSVYVVLLRKKSLL